MDRRKFIALTSLGAISSCLGEVAGGTEKNAFKIGITDWHLNAKCDPKAFQIAKECGLDGIQLSYIPNSKTHDLLKPEVRELFTAESQQQGIEVASMAMGVFNGTPFANSPDAEKWVTQCLDIMSELKQRVVLLAFFGKGDIKGKPELQNMVIERLKRLAPIAEKKGMVLGLETWLNMEEHMKIIDAVGSNAVKVYYDTANMLKMGYDVTKEIRWLGEKKAICQVHLKERADRLGKGKVNFPEVKKALEDIDYRDWLVIEAAIKDGWKESAIANRKYVDSLFNG